MEDTPQDYIYIVLLVNRVPPIRGLPTLSCGTLLIFPYHPSFEYDPYSDLKCRDAISSLFSELPPPTSKTPTDSNFTLTLV